MLTKDYKSDRKKTVETQLDKNEALENELTATEQNVGMKNEVLTARVHQV